MDYSKYSNYEIQFFKIKKRRTQLNLTLFINTFGKKNCNKGLCSGNSHYDIPIAPEIVLYEKSTRRNKIIYSGSVGGRVQNQWQGEFKTSLLMRNLDLKVGKEYKIDLNFSDPYSDFASLRKFFRTQLSLRVYTDRFRSLRIGDGVLTGFDEISDEGSLNDLPELTTDILGDIPEDLKNYFKNLDEDLFDINFPPIYSKVCSLNGKCQRAGKRSHLTHSIHFKVKEITDKKIILENYKFEKKSPLEMGYLESSDNFPKVKCK